VAVVVVAEGEDVVMVEVDQVEEDEAEVPVEEEAVLAGTVVLEMAAAVVAPEKTIDGRMMVSHKRHGRMMVSHKRLVHKLQQSMIITHHKWIWYELLNRGNGLL
jgi:hypothetical protein